MNAREQLLRKLAGIIKTIQRNHPVRVGIDGVDCSGKTSLSKELAAILEESGGNVVRISIDGFHNPKEIRYRQGKSSPRGYYEDTFNIEGIINYVLKPLGPGGDLRYKSSLFDFKTDSQNIGTSETAQADSILLFEGVFLHRPEMNIYWDFTIFIDVNFEETVKRAKLRDQYLFGSAADVEARYLSRYVPGQKIYLSTGKPESHANVIMDNNNIEKPSIKIQLH